MSGRSGRISKPRLLHLLYQALYIQELLAHVSIGLKPLFIPENDKFQALKASQPGFWRLFSLKDDGLRRFRAIFRHHLDLQANGYVREQL